MAPRNSGVDLASRRRAMPERVSPLRTANTKIETLNEINNALKDEWSAEVKSDKETIARLSVLMKLERQAGLRSRLGDDCAASRKRA